MSKGLTVLAVDDEAPALDELAYLLEKHADIGAVLRAGDATSALRELNQRHIDAIFLDINMPGLSGIELAGVLANFSHRPAIVFVTAHDDKAAGRSTRWRRRTSAGSSRSSPG
jgi:DNA-binding LytR/AlgR family response regulator